MFAVLNRSTEPRLWQKTLQTMLVWSTHIWYVAYVYYDEERTVLPFYERKFHSFIKRFWRYEISVNRYRLRVRWLHSLFTESDKHFKGFDSTFINLGTQIYVKLFRICLLITCHTCLAFMMPVSRGHWSLHFNSYHHRHTRISTLEIIKMKQNRLHWKTSVMISCFSLDMVR